ncbi:MAG: hypothetical protein KKA42_04260, partial [candidate division Zixibacteria bacterium]|nr:hypothetical protein [candidate division Zixibacteria bacterium]
MVDRESMKEALRVALKNELQKSLPLMDVESARAEFLDWLNQLRLPAGLKAKSWEEHLKVFPRQPDEELLTEGISVRMAVVLYIADNRYVISL